MKIALFLLSFAFLACKKSELPAISMNNVAYGNDPAQKMDIYLPANRNENSTKVIVLIHGGGWNQGDKSDFASFIDTLKKRLPGYAVFNINYRLATGSANFFPSQENDVRSAIEFIYNKRAEYAISDRFVLLGASAGGHLSLLQGYKYELPVKVKAIIDFFGPTELVALYNSGNPLVQALLNSVTGGSPSTLPLVYQQSGPYNYVTAASPPTMILHGGMDIVVPVSQSTLLRDKLVAENVAHEYVFYPTENHGWVGPNLVDSFNKIVAFLNLHVP